jgi:hypothetical protein
MGSNLNQAFILLTNKSGPSVLEQYYKIKMASIRLGDTIIMYHNADGFIPDEIKEINYSSFTNDILEHSKYTAIADTLIPGSNHFPLLNFYQQNPLYDYYWYIEDDVRFNGDWGSFFNHFTTQNGDADFISCHIRFYREETAWPWWKMLSHTYSFIPLPMRIRSFNPIFRISNAALHCTHQLLTNGWRGHHEVLMPTLLFLEGFKIIDFGGIGDFVLSGNENKYYIDEHADKHGYLSRGTMRYRPAITELEIESNKLYHPVKIL